jgi:hypothetical protein
LLLVVAPETVELACRVKADIDRQFPDICLTQEQLEDLITLHGPEVVDDLMESFKDGARL